MHRLTPQFVHLKTVLWPLPLLPLAFDFYCLYRTVAVQVLTTVNYMTIHGQSKENAIQTIKNVSLFSLHCCSFQLQGNGLRDGGLLCALVNDGPFLSVA